MLKQNFISPQFLNLILKFIRIKGDTKKFVTLDCQKVNLIIAIGIESSLEELVKFLSFKKA
jgi:hypothetical protein